MKKMRLFSLIIGVMFASVAALQAQVTLTGTSYTENFDGIAAGYPTGWMVKLHATNTAIGTDTVLTVTKTKWTNTAKGVFNYASADGLVATDTLQATQDVSTDRALGIRQTGSWAPQGASFVMQIANTTDMNTFSLSFKLQSLDASSPRIATWKVQYATGATPTTFTDLVTTPSTLTTGGSTWANTSVTANFGASLDNLAGPVWIRIVSIDLTSGSGNRPTTAIDDFNLTWTTGVANASAISGASAVCQGQNSVAYSTPVIAGASSYIWTLPNGATGTSYTNSITVNYGTSAVSGNIYVFGRNIYGDGTPSTLAITVNPLVSSAGSITGSTTVCQGQNSAIYTIPTIPDASSYIWALPNGATGTSNTNSIVVNYGITATSGNISVKGTNYYCDGATSTLTVIVNPLPITAGAISGSSIICQGQNSVTYTVPVISNATSYVWTLPNGVSGTSSTNSIIVNYSLSATSGIISVYGVNSCGNGTASSLLITVNSFPASSGIISGTTNVCQGQNSVTYSVPTIANATNYVWTLPNGATGSSTTNSISVNYGTSAVSGNITVKGSNSCGFGAISSFAVTVNPLTAAAGTISGLTTICQGQNAVTYTVPVISNATSYFWTLPNGATGSSTTNSITVNYGATATSGFISVFGTSNCGNGTASGLAITVFGLPSAASAIVGVDNICQGQNSVVYTTMPISNATSYVWTLPNGASGTSTTNSMTVNYGATATSGNITVKGQNSCGFGATSTLPITVTSLPVSSETITGSTAIVPGQLAVTYTAPTIANATSYVWTLSNGMTGISTSNTIIVNFNTSTLRDTICVKGTNVCGESATSCLVINKEAVADTYRICYVEYDTLMSKNNIVWATPPANAQTVNIYSEIATDTWGLIGTVPATQTHYIDMTSTPLNQSYNYRISMVDNLGVEGAKSQYHKTITLLKAYDQMSNTYGFTWSPYEGIVVPNYLLFGLTSTGNVLQIASVTGNTHFYNYTNPSSAFVKYFIGFYTPSCGSKTDYIVRSNFVNSATSGVDEYESSNLVIYPNPVTDQLTIELEGNNTALQFEIISSIGQIVYSGSFTDKCVVNTSQFATGIYLIKLENGKVIKVVK